MNKFLAVILIAFGLTSCTEKGTHYYQMHPQKLQEALKTCPQVKPENLSCNELQKIAGHMNTLAYKLQSSPQAFGSKILALQEQIATQQKELGTSHDELLKSKIDDNKHALAEYLAVVKWLESPVS